MTTFRYERGKGHKDLLITILLYVLPTMLFLILFQLLPIVKAVQFSFYKFNLISGSKSYLGLQNYVSAFEDPRFLHSLKITALYFVQRVPLQMGGGFLLALLLVKQRSWTGAVRTVVLIPCVTSMVVVTTIIGLMMHPTNGLFNAFLQLFHLPPGQFLTSPSQALGSIVYITVWKNVGLTMLFFLAGLLSIPDSLYEAAMIDGVGTWQKHYHITLPLLKSTIMFILITLSIRAFQVFGPILLTTGGGPVDSTRVVVMHIYEYAFSFNRMGYASALSVILAVILIGITLTQKTLAKRKG